MSTPHRFSKAGPLDFGDGEPSTPTALDGGASTQPVPAHGKPARTTLSHALRNSIRPFTADELHSATAPWAHAFAAEEQGLFPAGEVTVLAATGREGKTFVVTSLGVMYAAMRPVSALSPAGTGKVVIVSAEDDRAQYRRKLAALAEIHGPTAVDAITTNLVVLDLNEGPLESFKVLVDVALGKPEKSVTVDPLIEALDAHFADIREDIRGLLIFETLSALSDAHEDTSGHRKVAEVLKQIARALKVAVVLVHHTSQQASQHMSSLQLSTDHIRGATSLTNNVRQCCVLVCLGGDANPHPPNDLRTRLRALVNPDRDERVSVLVTLNSSKSIEPPPLYFAWSTTQFGPALRLLEPPPVLRNMTWRSTRELIRRHGCPPHERVNQVKKQRQAIDALLQAIEKRSDQGTPATRPKLAQDLKIHLKTADGLIQRAMEAGLVREVFARVPHATGHTRVYEVISLAR